MDNFEEPHLKGAKQLTIEHLSKVKTLFKATLTKSLSIYLEKNMLVFQKLNTFTFLETQRFR